MDLVQLRMMVATAEQDTAEGAVVTTAGAVGTITGELRGGSDDISAWV